MANRAPCCIAITVAARSGAWEGAGVSEGVTTGNSVTVEDGVLLDIGGTVIEDVGGIVFMNGTLRVGYSCDFETVQPTSERSKPMKNAILFITITA